MIEYDKDAIVPPYITEYLRAKTVHNDEFLHSLEKYAEENSVPIVEPETARFLSVMCMSVVVMICMHWSAKVSWIRYWRPLTIIKSYLFSFIFSAFSGSK